MPILRIISLKCVVTEDNSGADDAYIKINGILIWGPTKINDKQSVAVDTKTDFTSSATIELWEKDSIDPDDHLGTNKVYGSDLGKGEKTLYFNGDGCNYEMFYIVE